MTYFLVISAAFAWFFIALYSPWFKHLDKDGKE
jgi:hypothetical protein